MKRADGKGREKNVLPREQKPRSHCRSSGEECPVETKCHDYIISKENKINIHLKGKLQRLIEEQPDGLGTGHLNK